MNTEYVQLHYYVFPCVDIDLDVGITATTYRSVPKYYAIPFTPGGITLKIDVSVGYITCYISDTVWKPDSGNYEWVIYTRGYADTFINPAEFGRYGTHLIYITLVGHDQYNTYFLNSTSSSFPPQGELL